MSTSSLGHYVLLSVAAALFSGGCSRGVDDLVARPDAKPAASPASDQPSPPLPPPPPPPPPASQEEVGDPPDTASSADQAPETPPAVPPVAEPQAIPSATVPSAGPSSDRPSSDRPSIRLSAGVALPQTLPTGTAMGFSVDYEFVQGRTNPSSRYVWVIESAGGPPAKFVGPLTTKSTLQTFVTHWRPEHGPFQTHIEDLRGNRLSGSIPLR